MFTRQAPNIAESLFLSGLPQASVAAAQNLLGQCRAFIEHRGPVRFDYSNPNFRLITPSSAPINNHGSGPPPDDFPDDDAGPEEDEGGDDPLDPKRPQDPNPVEHQPVQPAPPPGPGEGEPRGAGGAGRREYRAGSYISITKRFKTIYVNNDDERRHAVWPVGLTEANTINSVNFNSEVRDEDFELIARGADNNVIDLDIIERAQETLFRLYVKYLKPVEIVTGVEYDSEGEQILITKKSALVFKPADIAGTSIPLVAVEYLTDATLGATTLDFTKKTAKVFSPEEDAETVSIPLADCSGA